VDSRADAEAALAGADVAAADRDAAGAVHRVVKTRVHARQARRLREAALDAGGECALSALARQDHERVDVVLSGTLDQFDRLADAIDDDTGLGPLADDIRERTADGPARGDAASAPARRRSESGSETDYPWLEGTAVMGVLNVTPDSFHDGGEYNAVGAASERAERMVAAGVDILDVGGESTRPGADPVPAEEEIDRVVPVIEAVDDLDAMVSIDTRKAAVARAALDAGADILNDVSGLEDPEMRVVAAQFDAPVVVMHSIETPVDPATEIYYDDVVEDVIDSLTERVLLAEKAGLDRSQILVDPGIGFGKTARESFELLGRLNEIRALGCPVLVGHSHKSMFELVGSEAGDAPDATVAATAIAADRGADVIRVHDAAENVRAVRVAKAAVDPRGFDGA
jgi:dihydropteroate synthase